MKQIKIENFNTRFPKGNNKYFNLLGFDKQQEYLLLYSLYSDWLIQYLINKHNLLYFDKKIIDSDNNFKVVDVNKMDLYQYLSSDYLRYFYLRNNIYIEKLNEVEYKYLLNRLNTNLLYDENSKEFIDKTYKKIIVESNDDKVFKTNYGPDNFKFYKPNNALILGFRYSDLNTGLTKEIFLKREAYIDENIKIIEEILNKNTDIPIYIIHYNDFSIKKLLYK